MKRQLTMWIIGIGSLTGCVKEPPPRSMTEFLENPILLEAAMVRCSQDRSGTRYEAECVNAREAVKIIEAKEDRARKAELEARSQSMRRARRRAQGAAAEVRRRKAAAEKLRQEAEYLAQFGVAPNAERNAPNELDTGNSARAEIPPPEPQTEPPTSGQRDVVPATDGGNAPAATPQPENIEGGDLDAIRDELRRRNEDDEN